MFVALATNFFATSVFAQATSVTLQLFPLTGEVRLLNESSDPFSFTFYSLTSPSGALNGAPGVWTSIADTYDASGNGFIDPTNDWIELSTGPMMLSEAAFSGPGGTLPAYRGISLGMIWDSDLVANSDISPQILLPNGQNATVIISEALAGDYFRDGVVDEIDYEFWKVFFGSTMAYFADGNLDGIIDAADYNIWRDNLETSLPASGGGQLGAGSLGFAGSVPEPASLCLVFAAAGGLLLRRGRRTH